MPGFAYFTLQFFILMLYNHMNDIILQNALELKSLVIIRYKYYKY